MQKIGEISKVTYHEKFSPGLIGKSMHCGNFDVFCSSTLSWHLLGVELQNKKINLTCNVTFLSKSSDEWDEVKKPAFVPVSYEGSDDDKDIMVTENNDNIKND